MEIRTEPLVKFHFAKEIYLQKNPVTNFKVFITIFKHGVVAVANGV